MNNVCLCTALPAESRPLIEHFKLSAQKTRGIRCYSGDSVCLVETGMGKLKAASAVGAMLQGNVTITALINVGIAGGTERLGNCYLASSIVDVASGKRWYPHLPAQRILPDLRHIAVHTHDKPSDNYQTDIAFDMEASGVLAAATPYFDNTHIQCIKIISDNATSSIDNISKENVSELISNCIEPVTSMIDFFYSQAALDTENKAEIEQIIGQLSSRIRISVSDSHRIVRLLQKCKALTQNFPSHADFNECQNARDIKHSLESRINASGIHY